MAHYDLLIWLMCHVHVIVLWRLVLIVQNSWPTNVKSSRHWSKFMGCSTAVMIQFLALPLLSNHFQVFICHGCFVRILTQKLGCQFWTLGPFVFCLPLASTEKQKLKTITKVATALLHLFVYIYNLALCILIPKNCVKKKKRKKYVHSNTCRHMIFFCALLHRHKIFYIYSSFIKKKNTSKSLDKLSVKEWLMTSSLCWFAGADCRTWWRSRGQEQKLDIKLTFIMSDLIIPHVHFL